jgi:acetyl esterase/lipase
VGLEHPTTTSNTHHFNSNSPSISNNLIIIPTNTLTNMASINLTKTVSYKTIGDLSIPMDIYLHENAHKAPILLWFHGGGLLYVPRCALST